MSTTQQSLGRGRGVIRADQVPDFIRQAAVVISDEQAAEAASKRTASAKPATIPSSMPFSQARKVVAGLKHIGKGVYEDNSGQVWWREGNLLKRRATDRDRLVGDYLADCKAKESRKAQKESCGKCGKCGASVEGTKLCLKCSPEGALFKKPKGASPFGPKRKTVK